MFERTTFSRARAFLCTWCLVFAGVAGATTVIAPSFETLVDEAELIFTGQVLSERSEWRNQHGQKSIVTFVTFGVQQLHKGRAANTVTLQFLGGTVGDVTLDVAEMPQFKNGERVVLFVANNGKAASPIIGFFHGRFSLRRSSGGREEVFRHDGEGLDDVSNIARPKQKARASASRLITHEDFATKIRERMATGRKQP